MTRVIFLSEVVELIRIAYRQELMCYRLYSHFRVKNRNLHSDSELFTGDKSGTIFEAL